MSRRTLTFLIAIIAVPLVLWAGWYLISPVFINRVVDEPSPVITGAATNDEVVVPAMDDEVMSEDTPAENAMTEPSASTTSDPAPVATDDTMTEEPVQETAPEATMDEPSDAVMNDEETSDTMLDTPADEAMAETVMPEETAIVFPKTVAQGEIYPIVHAGKGTATILELEDGARVLRLENFEVDNGPALSVWLVPQDPVANQIGTVPEGYLDLGLLKGNIGNQNYEIPAGVDLSKYKSVVVWCVQFSVPFAAAPLTAPSNDEAMELEETTMTTQPADAPTYDPIPLTVELQDLGQAPEITNDTWLNTEQPLRLADLRGKVVVVEFWTFGCYNCQNVTPYVKGWHEKYGSEDFQIVTVHYPEFDYEREVNNVQAALQENGITYPVAIDNEGVTWRAYHQRYWPVWYVLDKDGVIRYQHIGEGAYTETEGVIQALLAEPYDGAVGGE